MSFGPGIAAACRALVIAALFAPAGLAFGQAGPGADPADLADVFRSLEAPGATEPPLVHQTPEGYLRFIGAPPGGHFVPRDAAAKAAGPESAARTFIEDHRGAFGLSNPRTGFSPAPLRTHKGRNFVRLDQKFDALPVFGAQVVVQVDGSGNVLNVLSDVMRDTRSLDAGDVPLTHSISSGQALTAARSALSAAFTVSSGDLHSMADPQLAVFRPDVVGLEGPTRLVWIVELSNRPAANLISVTTPVHQRVFIDAHSAEMIHRYSLNRAALNREIYDAANRFVFPQNPARVEGGGSTGIKDVDEAYDFLGDTYNFYFNQHGFDSYDGQGSDVIALVRLPFQNAVWNGSFSYYGTGWATDDVVAHEFTHGVTQFTSDLIYLSFSGAINESFSDIWGEFVDLTNGRGNDSDAVRWLVGEDIPLFSQADQTVPDEAALRKPGGAKQGTRPPGIRSMSDPTLFGDPDRLGSPLLANPFSFVDNGGVHSNSGIGNKLCYLLTDGDDFNGQTVTGMGIERVADLFFATQFLLSPAADYFDLYFALAAASVSENFNFGERLNIAAAARAVEIEPPLASLLGVRDFHATPARDLDGNAVVAVSWTNPQSALFNEVVLLRNVGGYAQGPNEGEQLLRGQQDRYLDAEVLEGTEYFYTLIADLTAGFPQILFARALAGAESSPILAEAFGSGRAGSPPRIDLAFSQLTFTPVGPPLAPLGSPARGGGSYSDYEVTIKKNVFALPVPRVDTEGGSLKLDLVDDQQLLFGFEPGFPFFGNRYTQIVVSSNGYVSFQPLDFSLQFPSLAAHTAVPRISFLFSDLAPHVSGEAWYRELPDRGVLTFENIPELALGGPFSAPPGNTVQLELFYNGQIRITYLGLGAVNAVVGLSDGRGVPPNPGDIFGNVESDPGAGEVSDLSRAATLASRMSIAPLAPIFVDEGERVEFIVETVRPAGAGVPVLTGDWTREGPAPFADLGNGTGRFVWPTQIGDAGRVTLRATAMLNGSRTYQDIVIQVGTATIPPEARNLLLSSNTPLENPAEDRTVREGRTLTAGYTYFHPTQAEGPTLLQWFRNYVNVPALTNNFNVPGVFVRAGDVWHFTVAPYTVQSIPGVLQRSPTVYITGGPEIVSVTPSFGLIQGGQGVRIKGSGLNAPISVTFGGVAGTGIISFGDEELQVNVPRHPAGTVDVIVTTAEGTARLANGFMYIASVAELSALDLNGDGRVDALDVQLVVSAVLERGNTKAEVNADTNGDGRVDALDVQAVIKGALRQ